jgi:hypothetical protein
MFSGRIDDIYQELFKLTANQLTNNIPISDPVGDINQYLPQLIWVMLPIAFGWLLWKRNRGAALIGFWWFLVYLSANPHLLFLPGTRTISNFTVFISAYIPASLIIGGVFGLILDASYAKPGIDDYPAKKYLPFLAPLTLIMVIVIGVWGARKRLWDVDPLNHALVNRPDMRAYNWIQDHTGPDSRFMVNSFFAYDGSVIVGSDGGWWIPMLAGRGTTLPPLNYASEQGPFPDYTTWTNTLTAEINTKGMDHPDVLDLLEDREISHVYIGQRQGKVNSPGPSLHPDQLISCPHYKPVYHQDHTWVFEIEY